MSSLQQLREKAEAARQIYADCALPLEIAEEPELSAFVLAFEPDVALALLDTIDRLVALIDEMKPNDSMWVSWWSYKKAQALALVQEQRV